MIASLIALTAFAPNGGALSAGSPMVEPTLAVRAWQEVGAAQSKAQLKAQEKQAKDEKRHQDDLKSDAEVGAKYAAEADKEYKASTNQEYIDRVNRIGGELAAIANTAPITCLWGDKRFNTYTYKFKVVESKEVNAFSLPGGYIYVFDGLIKYVESDDELAGVMAHEISHASLRHLATLQREQSKLDVFTLPLILISLLSGGGGSQAGSAGVLLGNLANQAMASGWGQNAERAADYGGFQYMAKSKYNPVGMLTFMEKLARDQRTIESIDWGIYRTHPPSRERATSLEKYIRDANLPLRRSAVAASFRVEAEPDDQGSIALKFNKRVLLRLSGDDALKRSDALVPKLNEFFDSVPELYDVAVNGSTVTFRNAPLVTMTDVDGKALKLSGSEEAATLAAKAIKRELYMLAFRVWDAR